MGLNAKLQRLFGQLLASPWRWTYIHMHLRPPIYNTALDCPLTTHTLVVLSLFTCLPPATDIA